MCGRFALYVTLEELADYFGLSEPPTQLAPRYNIAPTQPVGLVRVNVQSQEREWALALWGLIPSWSKDPTIGARMINARAETVDEKPAFRAAFKRRRCIIPASGFYEWKKVNGGKRPYFITAADGEPLGLAGLWESWNGPNGEALESCTILTTDANETVVALHDRMPVILAPEDYDEWLGAGKDSTPAELSQLKHLLRPFPADRMTLYPVSTYVNSPRNEGEACIERVEE
ncbi:MAG: SOS response-associated peptidase [Caldilinea sp.]|jgi:putative SOS response-associated peptidase YedK|nr:SOS response-associated peptidase [Caldilinea sp.]